MKVWIIDSSSARGKALKSVFASTDCTTIWPFDSVRAKGESQPESALDRQDLVLVHDGDRREWQTAQLANENVFYFSGSPSPPGEPDWIQRSVSSDSITVADAREFVQWLLAKRKADFPALLRGEDIRLDLIVALAILCQAYLAVASVDPSIRAQIAAALERMGWDASDPPPVATTIEEVRSSDWWKTGLGLSEILPQGEHSVKTEVPAADELLLAIERGSEVWPPTVVARAYLELCERLSSK